MNRQGLVHAAQASVTSQPVQQALFLTLAIIVTLLMCQQYQRWVQTQVVAPVAFHSVSTQHFVPALAQAHQRPELQQVGGIAQQQTQQPHWVF